MNFTISDRYCDELITEGPAPRMLSPSVQAKAILPGLACPNRNACAARAANRHMQAVLTRFSRLRTIEFAKATRTRSVAEPQATAGQEARAYSVWSLCTKRLRLSIIRFLPGIVVFSVVHLTTITTPRRSPYRCDRQM
ncbi:uncharacterized protein FIBRA_07432 [Fibroporia radiculosa]|uniref:Uncharacterized protein n=1 Tax=Fibroporia radiculosa TaxID=599839 RepID=J4I0P0_9APHY|nr:uncharacterized protein FIBRA_07432 [Fibroporia radiculosa]CCM05222.1 predicted protein [Fibroporia radiculosa]